MVKSNGIIYNSNIDKEKLLKGDITKKCIKGNDIDDNFYYVRSNIIVDAQWDSATTEYVLVKANGEKIVLKGIDEMVKNSVDELLSSITETKGILDQVLENVNDSFSGLTGDIYDELDNLNSRIESLTDKHIDDVEYLQSQIDCINKKLERLNALIKQTCCDCNCQGGGGDIIIQDPYELDYDALFKRIFKDLSPYLFLTSDVYPFMREGNYCGNIYNYNYQDDGVDDDHKIVRSGTSFTQFVKLLLEGDPMPSTTKPSMTLAMTVPSSFVSNTGAFDRVLDIQDVTYKINFNKGKYTIQGQSSQDTEVEVTRVIAKLSKINNSSSEKTVVYTYDSSASDVALKTVYPSGTFKVKQSDILENYTYTIDIVLYYSDGAMPKSFYGADQPKLQIKAGTLKGNVGVITVPVDSFPSYVLPSYTISIKSDYKGYETKNIAIGKENKITYTIAYTDATYSGGAYSAKTNAKAMPSSITVDLYKTYNGTTVKLDSITKNVSDSDWASFYNSGIFTVSSGNSLEGTTYSVKSKLNYTDGFVPKTKLGVEAPSKQVKAGQLSGNSNTLTTLADAYPSSGKPSMSCSITSPTSIKVNAENTIAYKIVYTDGFYTGGAYSTKTNANTMVTKYVVSLMKGSTIIKEEVVTPSSGNQFTGSIKLPASAATENTTYTLSYSLSYSNGDTPKTKYGMDYPSAMVKSGTLTTSNTISSGSDAKPSSHVPTLSIAWNGTSSITVNAEQILKYKLTYNDGYYSIGANTQYAKCEPSSITIELLRNGTSISTKTITSASLSSNKYEISSGITLSKEDATSASKYQIKATINYGQGEMPKTANGLDYPSVRLNSGQLTGNTTVLSTATDTNPTATLPSITSITITKPDANTTGVKVVGSEIWMGVGLPLTGLGYSIKYDNGNYTVSGGNASSDTKANITKIRTDIVTTGNSVVYSGTLTETGNTNINNVYSSTTFGDGTGTGVINASDKYIEAGKKYYVMANIWYSDGIVPKTKLGLDYNAAQIKANASAITKTTTNYIIGKPKYYAGYVVENILTDFSSIAEISTVSGWGDELQTFTMDFARNTRQLFIAIPKSITKTPYIYLTKSGEGPGNLSNKIITTEINIADTIFYVYHYDYKDGYTGLAAESITFKF